MGGSLQEWTAEPRAGGEPRAVLMGGSFTRQDATLLGFRAAHRTYAAPVRYSDVGIRLAKDAPLVDLGELVKGG
jgi:hypothetical protein